MPLSNSLRLGLLPLVAASAVLPALAQSAPDPQPEAASPTLGAVTVNGAAVAPQAAITLQSSGLPTAVTVIGREDIARTNIGRDATGILRRVPGVLAHNLGQGDTGNSIKMRGFLTSTHGADVAVTVDGMPQNVPSSIINHGMNDMSWLAPDMVERIDVIKGPFSALYGDQARAGALNITTRNQADNSVTQTLGSYGLARTGLTLSNDIGPVHSLLMADLLHSDGYRNNNAGTRGTLFWKGSLVQGDALWTMRGVYHHSTWDAPGFLNLTGLRNGSLKPTDRDPTSPPLGGNAERYSLVLNRTPAQGEQGWYATAYAENYQRTRILGASLTDTNVATDDRRIFGGRLMFNQAWGERLGLTAGAETRIDRGDATNRRWSAGVPTANYNANVNLDLQSASLFAQGQWKPVDTLKLIAGLRADNFDYGIANRKLPAASASYNQTAVTPRAGLVWTPVKNVDLYANVGQGFRSPGQAELSPPGNLGPLGAAGGAPFQNLVPPKVRSRDVGVNAFVTDTLQVGAAYYHTLNSNEITQVSPGVFDSVGDTTRDGWELESRFYATDALSFYGSYGRIIRARINNPAAGTADRLAVPKDTLKAGTAYTTPFADGRLLLNADFFYISGVPVFAGTPLALTYAPAYVRYDLRATYEIGKTQLTLFTVFQPRSFASETATGAAAGVMVDPRPRAEAGVTVRYRF